MPLSSQLSTLLSPSSPQKLLPQSSSSFLSHFPIDIQSFSPNNLKFNISPKVLLLRLPLLSTDSSGDIMEFDNSLEPPSKKKKIIPYKLKDKDVALVKTSGTVMYTNEFKESVYDFIIENGIQDTELRYPEISSSVLRKWQRKAQDERGIERRPRTSIMAALEKKEKDEEYTLVPSPPVAAPQQITAKEKPRRASEPAPKASRNTVTAPAKPEAEKKVFHDDLSIEQKIKVVMFAIMNTTQKASQHFKLSAPEVHRFMSQNVIRRQAIDRIARISKGLNRAPRPGETRNPEEIAEIIAYARKFSTLEASKKFDVKEAQVHHWCRLQSYPEYEFPQPEPVEEEPIVINAQVPVARNEPDRVSLSNGRTLYSTEFKMKVAEYARRTSIVRACQVYNVPQTNLFRWIKAYIPEQISTSDQGNSSSKDLTPVVQSRSVLMPNKAYATNPPSDSDPLLKFLYDKLAHSPSKIKALEDGMLLEDIAACIRDHFVIGNLYAAEKLGVHRFTITTWVARHNLDKGATVKKLIRESLQNGEVPQSTQALLNQPDDEEEEERMEMDKSVVVYDAEGKENQKGISGDVSMEVDGDKDTTTNDEKDTFVQTDINGNMTEINSEVIRTVNGVLAEINGDDTGALDTNNNETNPKMVNGDISKTKECTEKRIVKCTSSAVRPPTMADTQIMSRGEDYWSNEDRSPSLSLTANQLAMIRELGMSIRCLQRWLELRTHYEELRKIKFAQCKGDMIKEIVTFRLDVLDYANKQGRVYAASVFRVLLSEISEWLQNRDLYLRYLQRRAPHEMFGSMIENVETLDSIVNNEHTKKASEIAERLGLDLSNVNIFIQQLSKIH